MARQRFDVAVADGAGELLPIEAERLLLLRRRAPQHRRADAPLGERFFAHALDRDPQHARELAAHARFGPARLAQFTQRHRAHEGALERVAGGIDRQRFELDAEAYEVRLVATASARAERAF